jgi:polyhydroxybutyrate depolymerase
VVVDVPSDYDPSEPAPLLVMLHGYGSSGAQHERYFQLAAAADERRMLYAHPDGTRDSDRERFWNATDACCDFEARGITDADYLAALIDEIATTASVDRKRIYFVGHSNGGFMSHAMACSHADLVAGIVSFAGMAPADPADCRASEPVTILQLHGAADDVILYEGGQLDPDDVDAPGETMAPYPSVDETATLWLDLNGCSGLVASPTRLDVAARIDGPTGPAEARVRQSHGCQPGGHVEVWTVPGGGHAFAFSSTFQELILDFLLAHPKP